MYNILRSWKMDINMILLLIIGFMTFGHANILINFDPTQESKPNEFIIKLSTDSAKAKREFVSRARSNFSLFHVEEVTKVKNNAIFLVSTKSPNILPEALAKNLKDKFQDVVSVGNNFVMRTSTDCGNQAESKCQSHVTNNDQWGLSRISNEDIPSTDKDRKYLWSDTNNGTGVTIYVVDSGVYIEHNEFSQIEATSGYTIPILSLNEGHGDLNGHGTHVAGIAAGHMYGVAKKARIVSVKVQDREGGGTTFRVLKGLQFVLQDYINNFERSGVRPKAVVNLSLGGGKDENIDQAIEEGSSLGLIYVAAAGNEGEDACKGSPASSPFAITVGATDNSDRVARFSNYGSCVDILAPGVAITAAGTNGIDSTLTLDGTSMAAPFVAGVIARLLSHSEQPSDVICVREHLFNTAIKGHVKPLGRKMPDRLLYAGCNTCFDDSTCTIHFTNYVPENSAMKTSVLGVNVYFILATLFWAIV